MNPSDDLMLWSNSYGRYLIQSTCSPVHLPREEESSSHKERSRIRQDHPTKSTSISPICAYPLDSLFLLRYGKLVLLDFQVASGAGTSRICQTIMSNHLVSDNHVCALCAAPSSRQDGSLKPFLPPETPSPACQCCRLSCVPCSLNVVRELTSGCMLPMLMQARSEAGVV